MSRISLLLLLFLTGCHKGHLYVQTEWVDAESLASTHVRTPDPRQKDPPIGQKLLIGYDFPNSLFKEQLTLFLTVRFWNNTQDVLFRKIPRRRGSMTFFFANPEKERDLGILTYRVQIVNLEGEIVETWEQQLWTDLIETHSGESRAPPLGEFSASAEE